MRGRIAAGVAVAWEMVEVSRDRQVTFLAASVAYYAAVSLLPLLLVALAIGTAIGGDALTELVFEGTRQFLSAAGEDVLLAALTDAAGRQTAGVVGTLFLLWSGLKLFRALDVAFSEVYGVEKPEPLRERVRDVLLVLVTVGLAAAVVTAISSALPALLARLPVGDRPATAVANLALLTLLFFPLYRRFPNGDVGFRDALPGAVLAATGWTALSVGFQVYAQSFASFRLYGVLGLGLLFVTWLYLASIVIILGAVANAVLTGRHEEGEAAEAEEAADAEAGPAPDISALERDLRDVQKRLDEKTVSRSELEGDLRAYVRRRVRRGHARGWGPYLVLAYGTAMTLGAFYFLSGGWAILAMLVVWLSTLGLYVLMLLVGVGVGALGVPGRAIDWVRSLRS